MKKLALLFLGLLLVSCGATAVKTADAKPLFEVLTQQSDGGASIRFFEILSEPNEIVMLKNDDNLKDKIAESDMKTANFIILNMGQKNTGGYSIGVESAVETDKNIVVTVKETSPDPNAMVTQALTNPFCVVRINSKKEIIVK